MLLNIVGELLFYEFTITNTLHFINIYMYFPY